MIMAFGTAWLDRLAALLPLGISGMVLMSSVFSGLWLLGQLLSAAALAWWMPPLVRPAPHAD
jgi:hypothetical protein